MARVIYFKPSSANDSDGGWRGSSYEPLNNTIENVWNLVLEDSGTETWGTQNASSSSVTFNDWIEETGTNAKSIWDARGEVSDIAHCDWGACPIGAVPLSIHFLAQTNINTSLIISDTKYPTVTISSSEIFDQTVSYSKTMTSFGFGRKYIDDIYQKPYAYDTVFNSSNSPSEALKNFSLTFQMQDNHESNLTKTGWTRWSIEELGAFMIVGIPIRVNSLTGCAMGEVGQWLNVIDYEARCTYYFKPDVGYDINNYSITYHKGASDCEFQKYTTKDSQGDNVLAIILEAKQATDFSIEFKPINYTISYNLNDNQIYPANPISNINSYTVLNEVKLNNPTRPGYTFKGWSGTGLTGDNNTSVIITKGSTGNRTYTANWTENYIEFEYWSNNRAEDNKKFVTWKASPSSFPNQKPDNHYNFTFGDYIQTYPGYKPAILEGYISGGYYNTKPDGSGEYSVHEDYNFYNYCELCDKYGVGYYEPATTIPIYCQWEPEILVSYDTIFNYFDWYRHEIKPGHASTIVSQNELGFTIKTNNGGSDGYSNDSPLFKLAKENGQVLQEYTIDVDVSGNGWQLFIFFYNDYEEVVTYSNGTNYTYITSSGSKIIIPPGATKAKIRVDSNASNNQVSFYNFRIYPSKYYYMRYTVPDTERFDCKQWSAPANPTRNNNFYKFKHWSKDPSLEGKNTPVTTSGAFPTEDTVLFSQWDKRAPRIFIQEANTTGGKAAPIVQLFDKPIRKAFIYTIDTNKWREC